MAKKKYLLVEVDDNNTEAGCLKVSLIICAVIWFLAECSSRIQ
jgi:hypothetical protein